MTEEALEQGREIKRQIDIIKEIKDNITPYIHEIVDLKVAFKKGHMGCSLDYQKEHKYALTSDDPLFLAIASALQDMIDELQEQFNSLDSNEKVKKTDPIRRTSFWKRVWDRNIGGKK